MVSDIFAYVGTSFLIAFGFAGVVGVVFTIYTYFRNQNSKLIAELEKDIDTFESNNKAGINYLRGVMRVPQADRFAADMTHAKDNFCEDIQVASHNDKHRLASYRSYYRQLVSISTEIKAGPALSVELRETLRPPSIPQRSAVLPGEWIQSPRQTDRYGILADGEGVRAPASVASTHASAAVENVRRRIHQTAAVEEGGTSPAVEATPRAPAAAEREDADSAVAEREDADSVVAEQEEVDSATSGGSIHLTTLRSTRSQDGDSAYFSIESSNTPTE